MVTNGTVRSMVKKPFLFSITALLLLSTAGCRVTYLFHAASGQFRLLHDAVPIEEALESHPLSPEQKSHLLLVSRIKAFGEEELGLKETRNYQTANLKSRQAPIYFVSGAYKDRLALVTWWFPIVGRMPYLGFFDLESAEGEKKSLLSQDLDVMVGRGGAYSTLGWFQDPVTMNLLEGSTVELVETILHEMTHATLYVKGQGEFNEGLAELVGLKGAFLFFQKMGGPSQTYTLKAQGSLHDERLFSAFLKTLLEELEGIYGSSLSREEKLAKREVVYVRHLKAYEGVRQQMQTERFTGFGEIPMNNAYLMSIGLYHRHFQTFEAVLGRHQDSIRDMLQFFGDLSRGEGDLIDMTERWLEKPPQDRNTSTIQGQGPEHGA